MMYKKTVHDNEQSDRPMFKKLLPLVVIVTLLFTSPALSDEKEDAETFVFTGLQFMTGDGVPKNEKAAFKLFKAAADLNDTLGQYLTGVAYERGDGVPQDYVEAERWLRIAAEKNFPEAQTRLGLAYYTGQWGKKDYVEAADWHEKAASNGDQFSMYSLGYFYTEGIGVRRDVQEAKRWLQKAIDNGSDADTAYSAREHLKAIQQEEVLDADTSGKPTNAVAAAAMLRQSLKRLMDGPALPDMPAVQSPTLPRPTRTDCNFSQAGAYPYGGKGRLSMKCTEY